MKDIEILNLKYCGCGRPYCDFFNPSEEEYGVSYSYEEIKECYENLPKIKKHLAKEIAKYNKSIKKT